MKKYSKEDRAWKPVVIWKKSETMSAPDGEFTWEEAEEEIRKAEKFVKEDGAAFSIVPVELFSKLVKGEAGILI